MKRCPLFSRGAVAVALLGALFAAPSLARASQPEPEARQAEKAEHETGAGEHARPKPINWIDFSNHEQPPWAGMAINFALLMLIYYRFGKKPIAEGLKNRRASVAKEIEEAQRMRHEAEERATKYQEKLRHLEVELKETRDSLKAAGEAERDRIVREAEERATRMEKEAHFLVEQEMKQMRSELTRDAIELAVAAAEELLRKRITGADQERLAEDYLAQLNAKRPSGSQEARPAIQGGE
jgi:ATP synthase F0 subunit b